MRNDELKINPHMVENDIQENQSGGNYYSVGGIEVKDIQKAKMPKQLVGIQCAYWANLVKYSLRCGWKGTLLKDLKKARDYLNWLIEDLENGNTNKASRGIINNR